jgi:hypothetical protein
MYVRIFIVERYCHKVLIMQQPTEGTFQILGLPTLCGDLLFNTFNFNILLPLLKLIEVAFSPD